MHSASLLLSSTCSFSRLETICVLSIQIEWRLRNTLPAECIWLLCSLSLSSFFYLTITLPTESRLRSRLSTESFSFAAPSPFRLNRGFDVGFRLNAFGLDLLGLDKQSVDDFPEQGYTPDQVNDTQGTHQWKQSTQGQRNIQ
jgi:hypothetical protein